MILDSLLLFTGSSGNADTPTTGTQTATNILDLGVNSGIPTSANGGGARDIGVGDDPMMKLFIEVTTTFVGGTSLQAQLSGAPNNGSGVPGSYTTMWTGPAVAVANLLGGAYASNVDVPRVIPGQVLPRFLRLGVRNRTGRSEVPFVAGAGRVRSPAVAVVVAAQSAAKAAAQSAAKAAA